MTDEYTPDKGRELDYMIAQRLGYRQNGELWEYDTPYGFPAVVEDYPHYSTDANALLTILRQWPDDNVDQHEGSLDWWGLGGVMKLLLNGKYEKLARAWIVWHDARIPAQPA